jgi:hypothetical protein
MSESMILNPFFIGISSAAISSLTYNADVMLSIEFHGYCFIDTYRAGIIEGAGEPF